MLYLTFPGGEYWDEINEEFINVKPRTLQLEHSLVSVSKWESKWCKAFLTKNAKSREETIDYIRCMTISQNVDPKLYLSVTNDIIRSVMSYIDLPMTATTINRQNQPASRRVITSEIIYSWMIALHIPVECQKWHLNRLITLIEVCDIENSPPKKLSKNELAKRNRDLNEARLKKYHTKG